MFAVVLSFDSLPCAALGCYGNEWIDTPHFDRLAAEGFVFDAHLAGPLNNPVPLSASGQVIREKHSPLEFGGWNLEFREVEGHPGTEAPPREWPFAKLMQAARDWLQNRAVDRNELLWLHSAGIPLPCRVPADVESLYIDEFADRGIDWSSLSPEERERHPAVQAAYVSCLDHFLGEFLKILTPMAANEPVLMAIVGVHGGFWRPIPRRVALPPETEAQWLRSPVILWTGPSSDGRKILPGRSPALVQPADLGPTLSKWFDAAQPTTGTLWPIIDGTAERIRDAVFVPPGVYWTEHDITVRTNSATHLFLWPEDPWQANDVASVRPDLLEERLAELDSQFQQPNSKEFM